MGSTEGNMAQQAFVIMTLKCQLVWLDPCYQTQDRLVVTKSFAARKVTALLFILLILAEREGIWSYCGAGTSCYLEGKRELPWGNLYPDPTAGLTLQKQEGNEYNAKESGPSGSWTLDKRWLRMRITKLSFFSCIFAFCFLVILPKFYIQSF